MKTVVFLSFNLAGHLNPTIKIANQFKNLGYQVYYAGLPELLSFTVKNNFKFHLLHSLPYATGLSEILPLNSSEKWFDNIANRFSDRHFQSRKNQIEKLVGELNPDWIFLDEFNSTDYLFFHQYIQQIRVIVFQTKFPSHWHPLVPPLNQFEFPSNKAAWQWRKHILFKNLKRFWNGIKYFGHDDLTLLNRAQRKLKIDTEYVFSNKNAFLPTFTQVEEWFIVPKLLDFNEQTLKPWQKYIGPTVDINKQEEKPTLYNSFLQKIKHDSDVKIIYCSFGSIANHHLKKGSTRLFKCFIGALFAIFRSHPHWYLMLSLEKSLQWVLDKSDLEQIQNVLVLDFVPQIDALKQADAFITHAGMTSILEAIYTETPMLLFPLNKQWDQPGNAARVVHNKLGIKLDFSVSRVQLENALLEVLMKQDYKNSIRIFKQDLEKMYPDDSIRKFLIQ